MTVEDPELLEPPPFQELNAIAPHTTGTVDDDDERAIFRRSSLSR